MGEIRTPSTPSHRHHGRRREDAVASAVFAALRAEGRAVEYRDPRDEEQGIGPGRMVTFDGDLTALEIAGLPLPAHVRKAQSVVTHLEAGMRGFLGPAITGVGGQVLLALAYSTRGVAARRRDRLASDTRILASEVRQTLNRLVEGQAPAAIVSPIEWVLRAEVTLLPGPRDRFSILQAPDEAYPGDLDDFVAERIESRSGLHLGQGRSAILAVDVEFDASAALRRAFDESPGLVPWWRVYQVRGREATLVHERPREGHPRQR